MYEELITLLSGWSEEKPNSKIGHMGIWAFSQAKDAISALQTENAELREKLASLVSPSVVPDRNGGWQICLLK